ncbi:pseudouridine synthase [Prochlorococcus sp. MIT 1307]|uniref:pseudouridine synthase n=1 Tax=Prochlorococcus sp. MIT 1307 TaxID=3096219 RepID=UPI002A7638FA|nr:pseudouridine synthase [Prochlorococcus sp. MIT 1307]
MPKLRLQKILSEAGICSRRKAEALLSQNRVIINGKTAQPGDKADPKLDIIFVDNLQVINRTEYKVILLNKPIGVISTCSDPRGRTTVLDLIPEKFRKGLHNVGRLDLSSRGAILLTNDGDLTLQLTHPRYLHTKTYNVWVEGVPSNKAIKEWENGLILDGKLTMNASVKLLKCEPHKSLLKIILKEGRKRQIRRIATILGHPVIDLQRTAIGSIKLNNLHEGDWRKLKPEECKLLKKTSISKYSV